MAARYDKGSADYINCPMTKEEYDRFLDALLEAQSVDAKDWENLNYFESCLPIEEIARRGRDTLRFGPMKPVGLRDPRTGQMPYAVVQLRQENLRADSYNLVGFQNHLKFGEQARVLRLIPGLENAKFLRYGQIHRNTYINGPALLSETLQMKQHPNVLFAGTDFWRGRLCGIDCHGTAGRHACCGASLGGRAGSASASDGIWRAGELHLPRRRENTFSRRTSRSICCSRWTKKPAAASATRSSGMRWCASGRWRSWMGGWKYHVRPSLCVDFFLELDGDIVQHEGMNALQICDFPGKFL